MKTIPKSENRPPARPKLIVAGGSGFLGKALAAGAAARGYEVVVLTRNIRQKVPGARLVEWDGVRRGPWEKELEGAEAVVNLAGKNVNCRYTARALAEIDLSRVHATRVLGDAIHACRVPPRAWVQASTLAIHGDAGGRWCDEDAPLGQGIPVRTARKWEAAFAHSPTPRTRRVLLRISFVLGRDEGALAAMAAMARWFLGGAMGDGRQFISWIHLTDMVRVFLRAVEDEAMSGLYVAATADPQRNEDFMAELRRALGRPWSPPVPAWLVRAGCWLLRTEPVLALTGRRGDPRRLEEAGFTFRFPTLREALSDLYPPALRTTDAPVSALAPKAR